MYYRPSSIILEQKKFTWLLNWLVLAKRINCYLITLHWLGF